MAKGFDWDRARQKDVRRKQSRLERDKWLARPQGWMSGAGISVAARSQARAFARSYNGTFEFMVKMKQAASNPNWLPTDKQAEAIFKCVRRPGSSY